MVLSSSEYPLQATPAATLQLPGPAYTMDVKYPLLVVGCADRQILVYNLQQIQHNPNPSRATAFQTSEGAVALFEQYFACFKAFYTVFRLLGGV